MRLRARTDSNQGLIVAALRSYGAEVEPKMSRLGSGAPDLLVCFRNRLYLLEVKDGDKPPSQRKLTPDEQAWHKRFPVSIVETVADAIRVIRGE